AYFKDGSCVSCNLQKEDITVEKASIEGLTEWDGRPADGKFKLTGEISSLSSSNVQSFEVVGNDNAVLDFDWSDLNLPDNAVWIFRHIKVIFKSYEEFGMGENSKVYFYDCVFENLDNYGENDGYESGQIFFIHSTFDEDADEPLIRWLGYINIFLINSYVKSDNLFVPHYSQLQLKPKSCADNPCAGLTDFGIENTCTDLTNNRGVMCGDLCQ
ncbi:MAG: hypothetical protein CL881_06470, partial [Dehalococcoidia bacterium]|nr:hypothetical protein [Dehalococcoidia bacterium]